ncbi:MAG: ribosomal L7Ae/L30e/S12e/Gadd45 family protein [Clostridia bacterium]|nr:ribosomal L7Ae/L30e/S12e/Gadd45 family protein [Clostridia bacterium]
MNSNALSMLGLCRKANKLSMGHDMCKGAVNADKACVCLVSSDSSQRVFEEFSKLCENKNIPIFRIEPTIDEIHHLIGYKAGIITIDDGGFAKSFMKHFKTEYRPGEETLYDK